jgi:hypothetical protein
MLSGLLIFFFAAGQSAGSNRFSGEHRRIDRHLHRKHKDAGFTSGGGSFCTIS